MPKVLWSEETLNGQAKICTLDKRTGYYLRIYRKEERKYSFPSLQTNNIEEARKNALDVYYENVKSPVKSRSKKYLLETAIQEYLDKQAKRVETNELSAGSLDTYRQRLYQRILPYAAYKKVRNIGDLKNDTWDGYKEFYQSKQTSGRWEKSARGLSAETINSDIATLNSFLWWCVHKGYVSHTEIPQKIEKVTQRKKHAEETIPAFYPDDWKVIVNVLENWDVNGIDMDNHRGIEDSIKQWRQELFRWWVSFQYATGCRPHETDKLRFSDITKFKDANGVEKLLIKIPPNTKTGKRDAIAPSYLLKGIWGHKKEGLQLLVRKNSEHNQRVKERWKKGVKRKADVLKDESINAEPANDDLLFFNVFSQKGKRINYSTTWYEEQWEEVLKLAMKNQSFPQDAIHKFTMYSIRATHITHQLLRSDGSDNFIELLAMNVGNTAPIIRSSYRRPMMQLNAKYLANATGALQALDDSNAMENINRVEEIAEQATDKLLAMFPPIKKQ